VDTDGASSPLLIACRFIGNSAPTAGGGAIQFISHSSTCNPKLINCILTGNYSPLSGAIASIGTGTTKANIEIVNSAISGNNGSSMRLVDLGMQTSQLIIRNSILYGNGGSQAPSVNGFTIDAAHSVIPFGFPGEGIIGLDPMFVDQPPVLDSAHVLGDLHLVQGSPALDAGINSAVPSGITEDADFLPRMINATTGQPGIIDIGPYEFQGSTTGLSGQLADTSWNMYPNPNLGQFTIYLNSPGTTGTIHVADLCGKVVSSQPVSPGQMEYLLNLDGLPGGIYLVQLSLDGQSSVRKIAVNSSR
jgi:Secretion system C-terminal sorting domain